MRICPRRVILSFLRKGHRMKNGTVFWDVDTQFDFMDPRGKLYVPGAEAIIEQVSLTRRFALESGYSIVADIDWHIAENSEISETPDFERTFPAHCMAGESGAERVGYLGDVTIDYVDIAKMPVEALERLVGKEQFHIVIKKESLDVFENPNTSELLRLVAPKEVIVFGVALDFCVACVLRGVLKVPGVKPYLLADVTKGLGTRPDKELFEQFAAEGVEITTLSDIRRRL